MIPSVGQHRAMVLDEHFDASVSRPMARWLAKILHRRGFSADQVSIIAMGLGVSGGLCFTGEGLWPVLGGLLLLGMVITDCADGEVARLNPPSDKPWRGRILDGMADLGTVLAVHVAMVIVLARAGRSRMIVAIAPLRSIRIGLACCKTHSHVLLD